MASDTTQIADAFLENIRNLAKALGKRDDVSIVSTLASNDQAVLAMNFVNAAAKTLLDLLQPRSYGMYPTVSSTTREPAAAYAAKMAAALIGTPNQAARAEHYCRETPNCDGDEAWEYATGPDKSPWHFRKRKERERQQQR
jgi:hypothetical protein